MTETSRSPKTIDASTSDTGKTIINDEVISKIAGIAAAEVSGVYALGGSAARAFGAVREAINLADLSQGIQVEVGEKQVAFDVTLVADYPIDLQEVAERVRAAIIKAIQSLVGMEVTEVNVTINDVHIPELDDTPDTPVEARVQ